MGLFLLGHNLIVCSFKIHDLPVKKYYFQFGQIDFLGELVLFFKSFSYNLEIRFNRMLISYT